MNRRGRSAGPAAHLSPVQRARRSAAEMLMRSSLIVFGCSLVNAHSYGSSLTSAEPPQHTPNCYGFPDQPFTLSNYVNICDPSGCGDDGLGVKTNDAAPNFQANDVAGAKIDLHDLLKSKPVFIQFGSFT